MCVCDCDGKIRYYDDNVDVIQLSWTDKNVLCLSSVIATLNLTKMWMNLEYSTDRLLCERVWIVVKVYDLLNSTLLVQYCVIHVYGSRLTSEYMK